MANKRRKAAYIGLCYHYVRQEKHLDPFPKILDICKDGFIKHLKMLIKNYQILSLKDALSIAYSDFELSGDKYGILITFDDGLSDHYPVACMLAENNIKGVFFIPTCILSERLPASPIIIHYCLAIHSIDVFLNSYRNALEEFQLPISQYDIRYEKGVDNPWKTISLIKSCIKYKLGYDNARNVLLHIYDHLLKGYPEIMDKMHLSREQVNEIIQMGHSIGSHSYSHPSIAGVHLAREEFVREVINPKHFLEETFNISVDAFSYPSGEKQDCLSEEMLKNNTQEYKLAFTINGILNTPETSPFELGRHMPWGTDDENRLNQNIRTIIRESI